MHVYHLLGTRACETRVLGLLEPSGWRVKRGGVNRARLYRVGTAREVGYAEPLGGSKNKAFVCD